MNPKALTALSVLIAAGTAHSQTVQVDVFIDDGTTGYIDAVTNGNATIDGSNNVTITSIPTNGEEFRVHFTGGLGNLGEIRHNVDEPTIIRLTPNDGPLEVSTPPTNPGANNWAGLAGDFPERILFAGRITGDLTGPVTARRITQFLAEGDIDGDITIDPSFGPDDVNIIRLEAEGEITGDIDVQRGSIGDIVAGTSILNSLIVAEETIDLVIAADGDIGTAAQHVTIRAKKNNPNVAVDIGIVTADNMFANIIASDTATSNGVLGRLITSSLVGEDGRVTDLANTVPGHFAGSIVCHQSDVDAVGLSNVSNSINVEDFNGDLTFYDGPKTKVSIRSLPSTSSIDIQGSLTTQIVINDNDNAGVWEGPVEFPTFTIDDGAVQPNTAPFYERLPSELGGGAIGLAPFTFHNKAGLVVAPTVSSTQFEAGDTLIVQAGDDDQIVIEHYAPVFASGVPLEIHKLVSGPIGNDSSWEDMAGNPLDDVTTEWTQTVSSTATLGERTVTLEPAVDWEAGWYRAKPAGTTGGLKCGFVTGTPDAAYDSGRTDALEEYFYFRIRVLSFLDLSQNFAIDTPDASMWLNDPVDFNDDGSADGTDFQMILDNMD